MEQSPITTNSDILTGSNTKIQNNKKLIIAVGLVGVIIVITIVFLFTMSSKKSSPDSENKTTNNATSNSAIQLKTKYKNPFDKNSQYDNPFENLK